MRISIPLNLYDLGLLLVFGFAAWQWFYWLIRGYAWIERKGDDPNAWWLPLAFVVWMCGYMICGVLFFCAMFGAAWKPWV